LLFDRFRSYSDGFLPEPGALTDQPNNLVIALTEISMTKGALDNEDAEKDREEETLTDDGGNFKSVKRS
jgi:hypothetical protein